MKKNAIAALLALLLWPVAALAQSGCPTIIYGAVLTAAQWNACFAAKQNALNYTPLNLAGGIMTGPLVTSPSTTTAAGLNVPPGSAPSSPNNGDFWTTAAGAFIQINGATINLTGSTSASFAATAPMGVTFPAGVVTYALAFNSSLVNTAGSLGINLANSNIFTANQTINLNAAPLSTPPASGVQIGGANSASVAYDVDAFAGQPQVAGRRANGTAASPTAVASGDVLLNANGNGYYGSGYNTSGGAFVVSAAQNYSSTTTAGTQLDFYVTANSVGNIPSLVGRVQNDGGLTWPPTVTGGDKGAGTINAAGLYINGTAVSTGGSVTSVSCGGVTFTISGTCPPDFAFSNCSLSASVGSNILTVNVLDNAGSTPTATSPCRIVFRNSTAATGSWVLDTVTSGLSVTTNATGASLGCAANTACRFWVVAFDNGGTVVLALFNAVVPTAGAHQCFPIFEGTTQSSTGFTSGATSAGVYYTPNGTSLSGKAIRVLGYVEYNSTGLATPGTYATAPNFVVSAGPTTPRPCQPIGSVEATNLTADTSGTTSTTPVVFASMEISYTPQSAANLLLVEMSGTLGMAGGVSGQNCDAEMSRGTTNNAGIFGAAAKTSVSTTPTINGDTPAYLRAYDFPNTISSVTYAAQRFTPAGTACIFPADNNVTNKGNMMITEIMG